MAKELPYFKFNAAEWISGEITLEDLVTQGAFINICAYYWVKSGCITLTEIKRRLKLKQATIDSLVNGGHIKVMEDTIEITFLRDQFDERGHISKRNSENGKKGGAPKGNSNAKNEEKNNPKQPKTTNIEEEEKREEEKREEEKPLRATGFFLSDEKLQSAWVEWERYRKEKKQKLTPSTAKKQMEFLVGRAGPEAVEIINQSIKNGWTGLFELKDKSNGHKQNRTQELAADFAERVIAASKGGV